MAAVKRRPYAIYFEGPSRTQQCFKDECDINLIIERARNGADVSHVNACVPRYGDFSSIPDYRSALDSVRRADDLFMSLDPKIRERFSNDPARMIDFLSREENRDEAVKLGLVNPPAEPVVTKDPSEVVPPKGEAGKP